MSPPHLTEPTNREFKQRTKAAGVFPDEEIPCQLVRSILMDISGEVGHQQKTFNRG